MERLAAKAEKEQKVQEAKVKKVVNFCEISRDKKQMII